MVGVWYGRSAIWYLATEIGRSREAGSSQRAVVSRSPRHKVELATIVLGFRWSRINLEVAEKAHVSTHYGTRVSLFDLTFLGSKPNW